jgi:hypothetical protein
MRFTDLLLVLFSATETLWSLGIRGETRQTTTSLDTDVAGFGKSERKRLGGDLLTRISFLFPFEIKRLRLLSSAFVLTCVAYSLLFSFCYLLYTHSPKRFFGLLS